LCCSEVGDQILKEIPDGLAGYFQGYYCLQFKSNHPLSFFPKIFTQADTLACVALFSLPNLLINP